VVRRGFDLTRDSEFRSLVTLPPASFPFMAIIFHGAVILHEKHFSSDGQGFTHYKSSEAFFSQGHTLPFMDIPSLFAAFQMLHWRPAPFVAHTFQYLCEAKVGRITKAYAVAHPSFRESVSPRNPLFDSSLPPSPRQLFCSCCLRILRKDRSTYYIGRPALCIYNDEVRHAIAVQTSIS
jgi:hypothetical protein